MKLDYKAGNVVFTPDGNSLVSPVGNRVSVFDLVKYYTDRTLPNAALLITVDGDGRALLINFQRQVVLHHHNFKAAVYDLSFSPDGRFLAVTHENQIHIWKAPGFTLEFAPFVLHRVITGHYDLVTALSWSADSRFIISSSKDMTSRIHCMNAEEALLESYSLDIMILRNRNEETDGKSVSKRQKSNSGKGVRVKHWKSSHRHYFNQNHAKIVSATFHAASGLLSVGFDSGIFGIWELPDFTNIHTLRSVS
ncbi:hypothetical protein BSLG_006071 [Batrachochytrium salamandrivorans]|nr:hypothetical protein BSLG_006071 [Batrachochytrium salamandrivorans]